ncbi:MAG: SRPBCC family protein [Nocardiaceae bacterium]|nr:SRPBCC family protein [Nocardiaceae bacterium]
MASVSVSVDLAADPQATWDKLADAARWDEWLSIHQKWKSAIPTELHVGTQFTEIVSVMGMANKIEWTIDALDIPHRLTMSGLGMAGVRVELSLEVQAKDGGCTAVIGAGFSGAMIAGPIGKAVAKNAQRDLEASLATFADLVAA